MRQGIDENNLRYGLYNIMIVWKTLVHKNHALQYNIHAVCSVHVCVPFP